MNKKNLIKKKRTKKIYNFLKNEKKLIKIGYLKKKIEF